MASYIWSYLSKPEAAKFPPPPKNPLAYTPLNLGSPQGQVSKKAESSSNEPLPSSSEQNLSVSGLNYPVLDSSAGMEEVLVLDGNSAVDHEENTEYRLLVKRCFTKTMIPEAIRRWRSNLQWAPLDLPEKLELGPIQAQVVPFWLFSATIEMTATGRFSVTNAGKSEESMQEVAFRDELNEIVVCATTDITPSLLDELFEGRGMVPPLANKSAHPSPPIVPRHPFHAIRYRDHVYAPAAEDLDANWLRPDIPAQKADEMIQDWLKHMAGPFLAEQQYKLQFGADAKDIQSSTSIRSLIRHLLLLPVYSTSYTYHTTTYPILISGINGHVAATRTAYGTGSLGRAFTSFTSGVSRLVSNNL